MLKEYERVFVARVPEPPFNKGKATVCIINDIYINKNVRLRKIDNHYCLTIKTNTLTKTIRNELNLNIPCFIGKMLFALIDKPSTLKIRTLYSRGGYTFEYNDHLLAKNWIPPLIEIEFRNRDEMLQFNPTDYDELGEEVSGLEEYRGYYLYEHIYCNKNPKE